MCGIIGYHGQKSAKGIVLEALKRLEYRGYDSWGIATPDRSGVHIIRKIGKIGDVLEEDLALPAAPLCIGHTRWATHGGVSENNAHPHLSQNSTIAVAHNGIIENYQELREFLQKHGFAFRSQTDTEVIPHLIQYHMDSGKAFPDAVQSALRELEGSFAILAVHTGNDTIAFGRRGSPLVLGVGEGESFVASDVPAFIDHTKQVIYLDDDEWGYIDNAVHIFDLKSGTARAKTPTLVTWNYEEAKRGDHPHFLIKEIHDQERTIAGAVEQSREALQKAVDMLKSAVGVFLVGCGTSHHACISSTYQFAHISKRHINACLGSEFNNYEDFITSKTLMIAVSQSGETADLLEAVRAAKRKGAKVLAIVNVIGSTLARLADHILPMNCGPEICVLSTKSYTAQVALLLLLAYADAGRAAEGKQSIRNAAAHVRDVLSENAPKAAALAQRFKDQRDMFLIGRDLAHSIALEGALKIKEVSYIHAEGFAGGELKHGTIALIEPGVPTIALVTESTRKLIISNAMEIKARGGTIVGIGSEPSEVFDDFLRVPETGQANPLLMILPIQLLAYHLALARGCDPDKPRNLAKSVTVK